MPAWWIKVSAVVIGTAPGAGINGRSLNGVYENLIRVGCAADERVLLVSQDVGGCKSTSQGNSHVRSMDRPRPEIITLGGGWYFKGLTTSSG
jgi:hypothetical protein